MVQKILVVDDSMEVRELLKRKLMRKGYVCESAANGADALRKLEIEPYELLISDVNMPFYDGFELLEKVRNRYESKKLPFLILTSDDSLEKAQRAKKMGAQGWVMKTLDNEHILIAIEKVIGVPL